MDIKELSKRALEVRGKYAIFEKERYGRAWNNCDIMQGFVGDVGDLAKLVMAKEGIRGGENIDEKLEHEIADCLWSVLVLSEKYGIDLEKSFTQTMGDIENRLNNL
ncbi:MAG: MazG nucleotide pyrophosphohydrolase [uncultured bacterium]|nr:MAG: MazG nucleotide pyrophosphohydrolase [uncultured bacterium]